MAVTVRFHFDPLCPWAWETSKWMREVEQVREVRVSWRLFSLHEINGRGDRLRDPDERGVLALRTLGLVVSSGDNRGAGELYRALGERVHDRGEDMSEATLRKACAEAGVDESLVDRAREDASALDPVLADHRAAVEEVGCFGVPTIILPSGRGIFGPVISVAPRGEEAGELWDRVSWLAERGWFFELKRERKDVRPGGPQG